MESRHMARTGGRKDKAVTGYSLDILPQQDSIGGCLDHYYIDYQYYSEKYFGKVKVKF